MHLRNIIQYKLIAKSLCFKESPEILGKKTFDHISKCKCFFTQELVWEVSEKTNKKTVMEVYLLSLAQQLYWKKGRITSFDLYKTSEDYFFWTPLGEWPRLFLENEIHLLCNVYLSMKFTHENASSKFLFWIIQ